MMQDRQFILGVLAVLALAALPASRQAVAQAPAAAKPGNPPPPSASEPALPGEILPKVFVLKDKDGNLQAMPGMSLEAFMEAWKAQHQLATPKPPPTYSLEKLSLEGAATKQRAELTARYAFTVLQPGWVGIPLRLDNATVYEPSFEGPGEHVLRYDGDNDGYVVWARAESGTAHVAKLRLLVPLERTGPETRLELELPRAAVSELQLDVPDTQAVATLADDGTIESVKARGEGGSRIRAIGLAGQSSVSWHAADMQLSVLPTVLEATGAVFIRLDGTAVHCEAKLTVRSLGGEFDRFQVRLPPGATYVGTSATGMTVSRVDDGPRGATYEVRLGKKGVGPVEVPLVSERKLLATDGEKPAAEQLVELAGFEVLGAVRQSGSVGVKVEGNWQVVWGESERVAQVEEFSAGSHRDLTAAFDYFAQPFSLKARVVPQRTRMRVQADYIVQVGSEAAQLSGTLRYTIRGAKVRALDVNLSGWEIDSVGPASVVNVDALPPESNGMLSIPLLQPISGELELTVEAHATLDSASDTILLDLPRPRADIVAPANLAVVPADNIELTFVADRAAGLAPQVAPPQLRLPERLQDPLFFRTDGAEARFAGVVTVHEQSITAAISSHIDLDSSEAQVDERIAFRIAYEPAESLTLLIPRSVRPDRLSITLEGQQLNAATARDRPAEGTDRIPVRVTLPGPRLGRCELQVRYAARHERPAGGSPGNISIPLIMPFETQVTSNDLVVMPAQGISATYDEGPWSEDVSDFGTERAGTLMLNARRALGDVELSLLFKQQPSSTSLTVSRGWIQTVLTDAQRHERAVLRFTTNQPRVQLILPAGAEIGSLVADLDGRRAVPETARQRELTFAVPATSEDHVLELRYRFPERPTIGSVELASVQLKSAEWLEQQYWELIVPAREHLVSAPAGYACEYRWMWDKFVWQREPNWQQGELEAWAGVAHGQQEARQEETATPSPTRQRAATRSINRYLFSSVGSAAPLEVYTISRTRLVLFASLPLLIAGLLLIYLPAARHPGVLFALAVVIAAAALIDPDRALLLGQASTLGLVLAACSALLARASARPVAAALPGHGSSKGILERGVTEIYHRAAHSSQPSTATEPVVSSAAPEGEP